MELRQKYGICDAHYISDMNVILASPGYCVEVKDHSNREPDEVPIVLKPYVPEIAGMGKINIYAMSARTEGLHIQLDSRRVLNWLIENFNYKIPDNKIIENRHWAHAYLLENFPLLQEDPITFNEQSANFTSLQKAPFILLHSICHALVATAKRHTGYDEKSLMEYLLPAELGFVIYVGSVQNYTAGGLYGLFEHYLHQWFDEASNFAFNCIMDPVCSEQGASCSCCLQQFLGCETFNKGLSRAHLHGGLSEPNEIIIQKGFWTE